MGIASLFGSNFDDFSDFLNFFKIIITEAILGLLSFRECFRDGSARSLILREKSTFSAYHKIPLWLYSLLALSESISFEHFHSTLRRST